MNAELAQQLGETAGIVERFGLTSLRPAVRACHLLCGERSFINKKVDQNRFSRE
jgi:hypothetical protein